MSDSSVEFEEAGPQDFEVVTLDDGQDEPKEEVGKKEETGPKKIELEEGEYQRLIEGQNAAAAMNRGIAELGDKLAPRPVNQPMPVDDWDPAKLEEEAWKPGKFAEVVGKITQRAVGQVAGQTGMALQQQSKKILELDPNTKEYYKKFEREIEQTVQNLPPNLRYLPNIYEQVYRDTVAKNQTSLIQEEAKKIAEQAVKEALEKAGVGQKGEGKKPSMYTESNVVLRAPAAKKLYMTRQDVRSMEESGMDATDKDQVLSYLEWKNRGGKK